MLAHGAGIPGNMKEADRGQKTLRVRNRRSDELLEEILLELRATNWLLSEAFKLNNPSGDLP